LSMIGLAMSRICCSLRLSKLMEIVISVGFWSWIPVGRLHTKCECSIDSDCVLVGP
jgi:hypothetical protein